MRKSDDEEVLRYAVIGMTTVLAGMRHLHALEQLEIEKLEARLVALNHGRKRRGRPLAKVVAEQVKRGRPHWSDEQRQAISRKRKAWWAKLSVRARKEKVAKMTAARLATQRAQKAEAAA